MYKTEKPKQSPIPSKLWIVTQSIVETRRKFLCYCQSKLQSQSWVYAVIAPKIKPWMTSHFLDNCATHLDLLRTDLIRAGTGRQVALGGAPRHLAQCAWDAGWQNNWRRFNGINYACVTFLRSASRTKNFFLSTMCNIFIDLHFVYVYQIDQNIKSIKN